jgi:hypothetical protein
MLMKHDFVEVASSHLTICNKEAMFSMWCVLVSTIWLSSVDHLRYSLVIKRGWIGCVERKTGSPLLSNLQFEIVWVNPNFSKLIFEIWVVILDLWWLLQRFEGNNFVMTTWRAHVSSRRHDRHDPWSRVYMGWSCSHDRWSREGPLMT